MSLELGFHVHSEAAADHQGTFDEQLSVVEFLRRVDRMEGLPHDATVYGLDDMLRAVDDPLAACEYIHEVLRDRVNYLHNENPRVQFVVEGVEYWDEPVLRDDGDEIPLARIFHGIEQQGPGRYYSTVNVTS